MSIVNTILNSPHLKVLITFYLGIMAIYFVIAKSNNKGLCSSCNLLGSSSTEMEPQPTLENSKIQGAELSEKSKASAAALKQPAMANAAKKDLAASKSSLKGSSGKLKPFAEVCRSSNSPYPFEDAALKQKFGEKEREGGNGIVKKQTGGAEPKPHNLCDRESDLKFNIGQVGNKSAGWETAF